MADVNNHRVLWWNSATAFTDGRAADGVIGQPNFYTNTFGTTATTLNYPHGVAVDSSGNVWVGDAGNHRILEYKASTIAGYTPGTALTADLVLGQPKFITGTFGTTATTLNGPWGVTVDSSGNVWVGDYSNKPRVGIQGLYYSRLDLGRGLQRGFGAGAA